MTSAWCPTRLVWLPIHHLPSASPLGDGVMQAENSMMETNLGTWSCVINYWLYGQARHVPLERLLGTCALVFSDWLLPHSLDSGFVSFRVLPRQDLATDKAIDVVAKLPRQLRNT